MAEESPLSPFAGKCVVMMTSYISSPLFEVAWRKLETTLEGRKVSYEKVDGADPERKALRTALWELSGERKYPQVFIDNGDGLKCASIARLARERARARRCRDSECALLARAGLWATWTKSRS